MKGNVLVAVGAVVAGLASLALAPPPPTPAGGSSAGSVGAPAPSASAAASSGEAAPPEVPTFTLRRTTPYQPWLLTLVNRSASPMQILGDPRWLELEVVVPGKKGVTRCRLPAPMAPSEPSAAMWQTLQPGQGLEHELDPQLYCFGPTGSAELVPGAQITPVLRSPGKKPAVVARVLAEGGPTVELTEVRGVPAALDSSFAAIARAGLERAAHAAPAAGSASASASASAVPGPVPARPRLAMTGGSDVASAGDVSVELRLLNDGERPLVVYVRRELMTWSVLGPTGRRVECAPLSGTREPDRTLFQRIAATKYLTYRVKLRELCPPGTFDAPGLYRVHARFASAESGADWGLEAWTGDVATTRPALVRLRGAGPLAVAPMKLVTFAPAPSASAAR